MTEPNTADRKAFFEQTRDRAAKLIRDGWKIWYDDAAGGWMGKCDEVSVGPCAYQAYLVNWIESGDETKFPHGALIIDLTLPENREPERPLERNEVLVAVLDDFYTTEELEIARSMTDISAAMNYLCERAVSKEPRFINGVYFHIKGKKLYVTEPLEIDFSISSVATGAFDRFKKKEGARVNEAREEAEEIAEVLAEDEGAEFGDPVEPFDPQTTPAATLIYNTDTKEVSFEKNGQPVDSIEEAMVDMVTDALGIEDDRAPFMDRDMVEQSKEDEGDLPRLTTREFRFELSDPEVAVKSNTLGAVFRSKREAQEEFKAVKKQHDTKMLGFERQENRLMQAIESRSEFRDVQCEIHYDLDKGTKEIFRTDTGEFVSRQTMSNDELKIALAEARKRQQPALFSE